MFNKTYFLAAVAVVVLTTSSNLQAQKPLAFKGAKIITMAGETIENGTVIFRDGKISDVGADIKVPVEARVIDASDKVIMPGFVEAHTSSGMSQANETNPIVPYVSVIDSIDPMSAYFRSARRNGVTTVRVVPGNSTLIGGQAAVIKTGGEFIDDMVLKSDAGVKISLRPVSGSRMGHLAKLRKALDEAKRKLDKKNEKKKDEKKDKKADAKKKEVKKDDADKKGAKRRAGRKRPVKTATKTRKTATKTRKTATRTRKKRKTRRTLTIKRRRKTRTTKRRLTQRSRTRKTTRSLNPSNQNSTKPCSRSCLVNCQS